MARPLLTTLLIAAACGTTPAEARSPAPADQFARILTSLMRPASPDYSYGDWNELDSISQVSWDPLPPRMLDESLDDGSYFSRHGALNVDGRPIQVTATGARTMVMNFYFQNQGTAIGEREVPAAFQRLGMALDLARCPISASRAASSKWWRMTGPGKQTAWLRSERTCDNATCERFSLLLEEKLASLTPPEQQLYTDSCSADSKAPAPPAAAWDEQIATIFAALIPRQDAPIVPWGALDTAAAIHWKPLPPHQITSPPWADGNHFYRPGELDLGGRTFTITATGTATGVYDVIFEERATHADRGDALLALWRKGFAISIERCGKVYSLSTSVWYGVTAWNACPVMIERAITCDTGACPKAIERYTLALTGVLARIEEGEVDAVGGVCPGR
jgi:hypothetical protein